MISDSRPNVPSGVKRALRQEAGFGCAICGHPILQYHHIVEWHIDHHFRVKDMLALCPIHHDQASKHALSEADQRAAKTNPFNIASSRARDVLEVGHGFPLLQLGANMIINHGPLLSIGGAPVLTVEVEDGAMILTLDLRDEQGVQLCKIDRNEWWSGDPLAWDIQADWQQLSVRQRKGTISLHLDLRGIPAKLTGKLWSNADLVDITEKGMRMGGNGLTFRNLTFIGKHFDVNGTSLSMLGDGSFFSDPDINKHVRAAEIYWSNLGHGGA